MDARARKFVNAKRGRASASALDGRSCLRWCADRRSDCSVALIYYCAMVTRSLLLCLVLACVLRPVAAGSYDMSATTLIGIALGITGGVVDNLGVCFQKLSHPAHGRPRRVWLWVLGISMYLFGNCVNAVGLAMTPQSVFAALGSLGLVTNAVNSRLIHKEKLNKLIVLGTSIIIVGSTIAVSFGSRDTDSDLTLDQLYQHLVSAAFICFMIVVAGLLATCFVLINVFSRRKNKSEMNIMFLSVVYPLAGGMVGSFTALFAKSAISLILSDDGLYHFTTYLFLAGVVFPGAFQVSVVRRFILT